MTLRGEGGDSAITDGEPLDDSVIPRSEKPYWSMLTFNLPGHGPRMAVFNTIQTEHHSAFGLKGLPKLFLELLGRCHVTSVDV